MQGRVRDLVLLTVPSRCKLLDLQPGEKDTLCPCRLFKGRQAPAFVNDQKSDKRHIGQYSIVNPHYELNLGSMSLKGVFTRGNDVLVVLWVYSHYNGFRINVLVHWTGGYYTHRHFKTRRTRHEQMVCTGDQVLSKGI